MRKSGKEKAKAKTKAVTLYKKGYSIEAAADATGISPATVWRTLRSQGVEIRPAKAPVKFGKDTRDKLIRLYSDPNNSISKIMFETGIKSEQTIYRLLKESSNVEFRRRR